MRTSFNEVLGQLEDLRLAEWADQAPPPPSHPSRPSPHTYANYPAAQGQRPKKSYSDSEPIYQPGQYAVRLNASCIVSEFLPRKLYFAAVELPQRPGRRWHLRLCWEISNANETTSSKNVDDASRVRKIQILNICRWAPNQLIIQNLCTNLFSVKITRCE